VKTGGRLVKHARYYWLIPAFRITSATGTSTSACFKTPIICSTLNRFLRIRTLLGFGRRLTFILVQKFHGKSNP
jgi:hypothetical protein